MVSSKKKGQKIMQQFLPVRKAFPTVVVLGIATLIVQRRARMSVAIP